MVASTTLLMDRAPTAASRSLSHAGEGPTVTPRSTAAAYRGHPSASSMATRTPAVSPLAPAARTARGGGASAAPGIAGSRTGRPSTAPSSRASPAWQRRSGRFGVTSMSNRVSATGSTSRRGVPGAASVASSRIPSLSSPSPSSFAEQSIPSEYSPRILRRSSVTPLGSVTPTAAKG